MLETNSRRRPTGGPGDAAAHDGETVQERWLRQAEVALQIAQDFSPTVGLEPFDFPRSMLLDITGLDHLHAKPGQGAGGAASANAASPPLPYQGQTPGERALVARLHHELRRQGLAASIAVADTIGGAWAWAHYGPELVAAGKPLCTQVLPVAALRLSAEPLARLEALGIEWLGQLMALPRAALPSRLGTEVPLRLEQLEGAAAEVIVAYRPPALAAAGRSLEFPAKSPEVLEALLAQLLAEVIATLPAGQGIEQLVCRLREEGGRWLQFAVGLYQATARADHLLGLMRLRLETLPLAEPVEELHLEVPAAGELTWQQRQLFEPRPDIARQRALLIDRLSTRLGRRAVLRARCVPDAQPEFACRLEPLIPPRLRGTTLRQRRPASAQRRRMTGKNRWPSGSSPRDGSSGSPAADPWLRPWRLFARPTPVEVVSVAPDGPPQSFMVRSRQRPLGGSRAATQARLLRIVRHWGPERIETAWWRGQLVRRDYYRVEIEDGRWFWLFRDLRNGRWFWHGSFG